MQLLTALPMFAINAPGNVIEMNKVFDGIANFKIVEKEQLYDWIVVPAFGTTSSEEKAIADGVVGSTEDESATSDLEYRSDPEAALQRELESGAEEGEEEEASYLETVFAGTTLLMNILLIALVLMLFAIVTALLILCRRCVRTKCCGCAKTSLRKIESKIMYNSLLRAALESYFLVSIGAVYGVRHGKQ